MVTETSIAAFRDINKAGISLNQASIIYDYIAALDYAPTRREVANALGMETSTVSARVNGLKDVGKLKDGERRLCSISKKSVLTLVVCDE